MREASRAVANVRVRSRSESVGTDSRVLRRCDGRFDAPVKALRRKIFFAVLSDCSASSRAR